MTNPYLEGNFGPVTEEVTVTDLEVTGTIPAHLDGRYVRNGPNPLRPPEPSTYHWFTGDGMVHGVRIRDGKAEWYRNRWVRSGAVADALGEPRRPGDAHGNMDFAANTNVVGHAGSLLAIVEGGSRPYQLDLDLETVRVCDFDGTLPGGYTAHPKRDPETGELHAVSYYWGWGNVVQYTVVDVSGRVRRTVEVPFGASPMLHDMSLTESSVILYDQPVVFDLDMATGGSSFPYRWDPGYTPRIGVLPREGDADDVQWYEVEPCYVFHPMNAYDDGDRIVLDVVRHPKMFDRDRLGPGGEGSPTLDRWTIDPAAGKVIEERTDDRPQEFPRVDERLVGRRHRFGYAAGGLSARTATELIKHDFAAGTSTTRSFPHQPGASEFVFVPAAADAAEDDGVLIGFEYNETRDSSDLLLLDAETLDDVAIVHLPVRVPFGFHGNWVDDPSR